MPGFRAVPEAERPCYVSGSMTKTTTDAEPDPFDAIVDAPFDDALSDRYPCPLYTSVAADE